MHLITHYSLENIMSFFSKIAVAIRAFNTADTLQQVPAGVKSLSYSTSIPTTHAVVDAVQYKGSVIAEDLVELNSTYIRNAVAQLGAWTALAKGFNAFLKDPKSAEPFVDEFHYWNSITTTEAQMSEEATINTIAKLSQVKPAKGNEQTDAIISRVRKVSVDALKAEREVKAAKDSAKREAGILAFDQMVWATVGHGDGNYSISGAKAVSKAMDTMMWIANWTGNPDQIAGELLLCESDIANLERVARKEAEREGESIGTFGN